MMKKLPTVSLLFVLLSIPCSLVAQKQKEHPKGSYVDSLHRYYQQADLPVYINISTSPNGKQSQLKEANSKEPQPMHLDGHGIHNLRHLDVQNNRVANFQIFADGIAPKTTISYVGAEVYKKGKQVFYGKNLTINIRASDDMSGVSEVLYSLNGADYSSYTSSMPISKEGDYTYKYYSVDNVGNVEVPHEAVFTVDVKAPETFYSVVGITEEKVISLTTVITLTAEDAVSGIAGTYYSFDGDPMKRYVGGKIPINTLATGEHVLNFYSVDNLKNQEETKTFVFYLDRTAPIMSADVLGDRFIVDDKVYFSGKTRMKLTAIDNRAGIKDVFYSINNSSFEKYKEPFYMPAKAGQYSVSYYATDRVGNNSGEDKAIHSSGVVYVDLTGPVINSSFVGTTFKNGDVSYISSKVAHKLTAKDSESGFQRMAYIIDNGEEQPYSAPFNITSKGLHEVTAVAYDNVNNRNIKTYKVFVDDDGPEINYSFSTKAVSNENSVETYPSYVTLFLSASDDATTVSSLSYSIDDAKDQTYANPIKGFEKMKTYNVKVKSLDALGNESIKLFKFKTNEL